MKRQGGLEVAGVKFAMEVARRAEGPEVKEI